MSRRMCGGVDLRRTTLKTSRVRYNHAQSALQDRREYFVSRNSAVFVAPGSWAAISRGSQSHFHGCRSPILIRTTSLIRNTPLLRPYRRTIPRVMWWSQGGGLFLMSKVTPELVISFGFDGSSPLKTVRHRDLPRKIRRCS